MAIVNDNAEVVYDRMKEVKEFDDSKIGVKGLVDSGITTIPRFFVHPPENLPDPNKPSLSSIGIPIIDLSNIQRSEIINQVCEAASSWGFFQVINHNIPLKVLDATIDAIKSFHEQPFDIKKLHYVRGESVGYMTNLDLFKSRAAGWLDSLIVTIELDSLEIDRIPAICRDEVIAWDDHATKLGEMLMEILSEGLGLESGKLKEMGGLERRTLAGNYYPYCPQSEVAMGIPSHTDAGLLTVLLHNQMEGLQVKYGDDWVEVNPQPGALIVNVGDFMQVISNDQYKSCKHRVLANAFRQPRISMATFINVGTKNDHNSIYYGPLDELLTPEKPALYRKFKLSEYNHKFLNKGIGESFIYNFRI